jgi:hypothetical protein
VGRAALGVVLELDAEEREPGHLVADQPVFRVEAVVDVCHVAGEQRELTKTKYGSGLSLT